ncbi:MAG: AAA family ATPase [Candidatus Omnitrophica bacterium]|nr:AAA family ATPase [Candidatus Omnitrophota bacterium]
MYLKELVIFGFKSFPEKTSLKFESGITVVVGPNGCGKSNVFDAIKWALGEQSPKSLRGSKMEDIIFNGTERHSPLNYAEVTLNFFNEDKYLPIDYNEVSITRRLYRSGESQYSLNKNIVRLRDLQELFMGTGVGESTYSFIEQGKIEIFLSYKPEDKRAIFDEASGIVKYKERKKEALRRLKETDDNLLRLEDILTEVRRQTRYLERQVSKAKKYKIVYSELIEVEQKIAGLKVFDLEKDIGKLLEELDIFKNNEQEKSNQLNEVNEKWESLNSQLKVIRVRLEEATTAIVSLSAQIENFTSHIEVNNQRIKELEGRNETLKQSKINLNQRLDLQEKRNQEEKERMLVIEKSVLELDDKVKILQSEKEALKIEIEREKKETVNDKMKIVDLEEEKAQCHNTLIEIQAKLSSLINRKKRLIIDNAKLDTLLTDNKESLTVSQEDVLITQESLRLLQDKKINLIIKEKEVNVSIEKLKGELVEKEKELLELKASYEFLKDFSTKFETFSNTTNITVIFKEEPKNINKVVASLKDVVFSQDGCQYKAQIEAKVLSFDEKQLEEKISATQREINDHISRLQDLDKIKTQVIEELEFENTKIDDLKEQLQEKLQEKDVLTREVDRLEEEFELLNQEVKSTLEDIEVSEERKLLIEQELVICDTHLNNANNDFITSQDIVSKDREKVNEIEIDINRSQAEKNSLYKEKDALSAKILFFQDEMNNIRNNLSQIDKEIEDNSLKIGTFNEQIQGFELKIIQYKEEINNYAQKKQKVEQSELLLNGEIEDSKILTHKLDKENQEVRAAAYSKKMEIQNLEYEKEKIKNYLKQVYELEFNSGTMGEITEAKDNLLVLKEKLQKNVKSLGEVNLVAIEEFQELKKREDFLDAQKLDLVTSKDKLMKAIYKINKTSKELFLETFRKIEVEFKKNFKFLFNGGNARLILLDPNNILESGVEIEVQPPGKKSQNISLLSGGEKALTSIALIFAIFQVRPSPLCVLDEIDAPLDEANVDRFNHLLKKFSRESQFIVITHNKKTMSNADVLYGVTMQEKGISKMVSVKFASEQVDSEQLASEQVPS